ncbi:MAG: cytochrome c [Gammaproteobacteria bacterium]|nr:cytochrome c [Gammaproteobacteria bacterium]
MRVPLLLVVLLPLVAYAAGDPGRGAQLAGVCAPCHGIDGVSPAPSFPILAGQHAVYLESAIRAYRDKQRPDPVMGASVLTMSDQDIADVAAYYESRKGLASARGDRSGPNQSALAASEAAGVEAVALAAGTTQPVAAASVPPGSVLSAAPLASANTLAGCPVDNRSIPEAQDFDRDGLPDRHDGAPADANEFARDSNGDGWFEICSIRQLQAIQTLGAGVGNATNFDWAARVARRYHLVRDLDARDLGAPFSPIGDCGPQGNCMLAGDKFGFTGLFDGGGHVIKHLSIAMPEAGGVGLFGVLAKSGTLSNLVLEDAVVSGRGGVGAMVGANFGLIRDCRGSVEVTGKNAVGALVGGHAGKVIRCHASGTVSGNDAVGGLIGDMRGFVAQSSASTRVSGHNGVGALVGLNTFSTLESSYATGSATGNNNVGGLVGLNTDAVVTDSWSTAEVESMGTSAGGLVAFNSQSRVRNSYARGRVIGVNSVGGLVGTNNGTVRASYATGRVAGTTRAGGLVGDNSGGTVAASYWDTRATGRVFGAGSDDAGEGGRDDNEIASNEVNSLGTFAKSAAALRALNAANTGWHPAVAAVGAETYHCDADADSRISADEQRPDNLAWVFSSGRNPGISCTPGGLDVQRLR